MIKIGELNKREILYTNTRADPRWSDKLPSSNWLVFTIADTEDKDLLNDIATKCLDKNVLYTCSTGQLASETEEYFDQEIVWRQIQLEQQMGKPQDCETTPMTAFHKNFDEGFWFAATFANAIEYGEYIPIHTVVCIDMTRQGVKNYLSELIGKIKNGWLPSDNEIVIPQYDNE